MDISSLQMSIQDTRIIGVISHIFKLSE